MEPLDEFGPPITFEQLVALGNTFVLFRTWLAGRRDTWGGWDPTTVSDPAVRDMIRHAIAENEAARGRILPPRRIVRLVAHGPEGLTPPELESIPLAIREACQHTKK
jgi:hypothetical protein